MARPALEIHVASNDWQTTIDSYCERLTPDFWAEPGNALSNLAFWVAAYFLSRVLWTAPRPADRGAVFLTGVLWAIGLGSFLFHTFATRWAALADVLPIAVFICSYVFLGLRRFLRRPQWQAAMGPPVLIALGVLFAWAGLGGASGYLPALLGLLAFAAATRRRQPEVAGGLLIGAGVFAVSLTLRTLDLPLCASIPAGTHWAWHLLNALTLWQVTRVYMGARPLPRRPGT